MILDLLKFIHGRLLSLNNSKFFAGIIMIILNIGSKYITIKLSKTQESYLRNTLARQVLIFAIAWMGTKDIYLSLVLTAIFVVLSDYLLNEKSRMCMIPKKWIRLQLAIDTDRDGIINEQEINQAISVLEKAKRVRERQAQFKFMNDFDNNNY